MTWSKNVVKNAKISNKDLTGQLNYEGDDLYFTLVIHHEDSSIEGDFSKVKVSDHLTGSVTTGTDQNRFNQLMLILRDAAFTAKGYVES